MQLPTIDKLIATVRKAEYECVTEIIVKTETMADIKSEIETILADNRSLRHRLEIAECKASLMKIEQPVHFDTYA